MAGILKRQGIPRTPTGRGDIVGETGLICPPGESVVGVIDAVGCGILPQIFDPGLPTGTDGVAKGI